MTIDEPADAQIINAIETQDGTIALPLFDGQALRIFAEIEDFDAASAVPAVRNLLAKVATDRADLARHLLAHLAMVRKAVSAETVLMDGVDPTAETIWDSVKLGMLQLSQVGDPPWAVPTFDADKPLYVTLDLNVAWYPGQSVVMTWEDGQALVKVGEHGSPIHDVELGEGHESCIFHAPWYGLCTTAAD